MDWQSNESAGSHLCDGDDRPVAWLKEPHHQDMRDWIKQVGAKVTVLIGKKRVTILDEIPATGMAGTSNLQGTTILQREQL
jgi:hypothetical protein